MRSVLYFLSL